MTTNGRAADVDAPVDVAEEDVPIADLRPHPRNYQTHPDDQVEHLMASIREFGFFRNIVVARDNTILAGHGAVEAATRLGMETVPARRLDLDPDSPAALKVVALDNEVGRFAVRDEHALTDLLALIAAETTTGLLGTGFNDDALRSLLARLNDVPDAPTDRTTGPSLADRFLVPPFSVLDARQGYWQERKQAWLALGIKSELGRPRNLLKMSETVLASQRRAPNGSVPDSDSGNDPQFYWKKQTAEKRVGRELSTAEFLAEHYEGPDAYVEGTSVFDPVLCELAYRWWSPEGAVIFDPFAGGSVRGLVASRLGRRYEGVDLSAAQVEANEVQRTGICRPDDPEPVWRVGDARTTKPSEPVDFVFSCPPYFDLEQYTDDQADLSNAPDWHAFCEALNESVTTACSALRPGRFACFVVGNVRERHDVVGRVQDLGAATVAAFEHAGLVLYNDAVLVTAVGSLAIRGARIFRTRKLGRTHQLVFTFLNPPLDEALEVCGPIEVADPAEAFGVLQA